MKRKQALHQLQQLLALKPKVAKKEVPTLHRHFAMEATEKAKPWPWEDEVKTDFIHKFIQ